jgi:hypothetical protein
MKTEGFYLTATLSLFDIDNLLEERDALHDSGRNNHFN